MIPIDTLESEIFHCYFSLILQELNLEPGERLWQRGVESTQTKASHLVRSQMGEKSIRSIARYIAGVLGYDAKTKMEFKLNSFCPENVTTKEKDDAIDNHESLISIAQKMTHSFGDVVDPCSSKSLEEKDLISGDFNSEIASDHIDSDDEDNDIVEPNTFDFDEWVKGLEPIVCLGNNPLELEFPQLPKLSKQKYIRTWHEFLNLTDICLGYPPNFAQIYGFIEMQFIEGKSPATIAASLSHINMGLQMIYNRKLTHSKKILG